MNKTTESTERRCAYCWEPLVMGIDERPSKFKDRKYCDRVHAGLHIQEKMGRARK